MDTAGTKRSVEPCGPSDRANCIAARNQVTQFLNPMLRVCFFRLFLGINCLSVGSLEKQGLRQGLAWWSLTMGSSPEEQRSGLGSRESQPMGYCHIAHTVDN